MKVLVIAEKPSVARDIARVLGCKKNGQGMIEGEKYIITWGLGHLVTLADPEEYTPDWKEWKMEVLPMVPKSWKLTVIRCLLYTSPSPRDTERSRMPSSA